MADHAESVDAAVLAAFRYGRLLAWLIKAKVPIFLALLALSWTVLVPRIPVDILRIGIAAVIADEAYRFGLRFVGRRVEPKAPPVRLGPRPLD